MTTPHLIQDDSFQVAWIKAVKYLSQHHWDYYNLIVQIKDTRRISVEIHNQVIGFSNKIGIIPPKDVAYTIFPKGQYQGSAQELYQGYLTKFYPWSRKKKHSGWGTYFERMINYLDKNGTNRINQLQNIINAINSRDRLNKAAYTITLTYPGGETIRPLGGPCLNYITIQTLQGETPSVGLMAIYRNHEFLERAYGNYLGLCNLLEFINDQTNTLPGPITCISSHAFVKGNKVELSNFIESFEQTRV